MHAPVVDLIFSQRETETVARGQVSDDLRQARRRNLSRARPSPPRHRIAARGVWRCHKTHPEPTSDRFADRQQKLEQRAQLHSQRVEDHVVADQDLFGRIAILKEDRRDSIRHPHDRHLRVWPHLFSLARRIFNRRSHVVNVTHLDRHVAVFVRRVSR